MYFWMRVVPGRSPQGPPYMLSVTKMEGPGGPAPYVTFQSLDALEAAVRSIPIGEQHIQAMLRVVQTGDPFDLPNLQLTVEDIARLGLYVIGKDAFAAISAVEGLVLHPESEKRLNETEDLSPEERRASTIETFVKMRRTA